MSENTKIKMVQVVLVKKGLILSLLQFLFFDSVIISSPQMLIESPMEFCSITQAQSNIEWLHTARPA